MVRAPMRSVADRPTAQPEASTVAAWHQGFHRDVDRTLLGPRGRVDNGVGVRDRLRLLGLAIEGIVAHELGPVETRRLCELLAAQLAPSGDRARTD